MFSDKELKIIIEAQDKASSAFKKIEERVASLTQKTFNLLNPFASLEKALVTIAGTTGFGMLTKSFIDTASAFEQFNVQLTTVLGSAQRAKAALGWIQTFTAQTPYELDEVTQAFIKLQTYGIDPTTGVLKVLGDTASSMGKSLDQAVEALADALQGEFERLKEFGIRARATADQVTFYYMKAGQQMAVTVKNSAEEIQKALLSIWGDKFAGGMERMSHTLQGILSNLSDYWTQFKNEVMESGVYNYIKAVLETLLEKINQLKKSGKLDEWARKVGGTITSAFEGVTKTLARLPIYIEQAKLGFVEFFSFIAGHSRMISILLESAGAALFMRGKLDTGTRLFAAGVAIKNMGQYTDSLKQVAIQTKQTIEELRKSEKEINNFFTQVHKKYEELQKAQKTAAQATQNFANAQKNLNSALQQTLSTLDKQKEAAKGFQKELQEIMEKVNWQLMTPEQQYNYVKDKLQDLWNEAWSNEDVKAAEEYVSTFQKYMDILSQFEGKENVLEKFREDLEELSRVFTPEFFEEQKKKLLGEENQSEKIISDKSFKDAKEKFLFIETEINYLKSMMPIELQIADKASKTISQIKTEIGNLKSAIDELKNQGISITVDEDTSKLSEIAKQLNSISDKTIKITAKDEVTSVIEKIKHKLDEIKEITIDVKIRRSIENLTSDLEKAIKRGQLDLSGGQVG